MRRASSCFSLLLLGAVLPVSAHAQWQFAGSLGVRHVHMKEIDTFGQTLVTERGWLPGARLRAEYGMQDWRFGLSGDVHGNDINYDGRLQNGTPFRTDTGTIQSRLGVDIARRLNAGTQLIAAVEWDYWKRRIKGHGGVLGIDERYTSWRVMGGAEFDLMQGAAGALRAKALLVAASPEKMRVRFDTRLFDDARLSTKAAAGARLGLTFVPADLPAMTVGVEFDWLKVGRSASAVLRQNGSPAGTVTQSEHVRRAIEVHVSYRF